MKIKILGIASAGALALAGCSHTAFDSDKQLIKVDDDLYTVTRNRTLDASTGKVLFAQRMVMVYGQVHDCTATSCQAVVRQAVADYHPDRVFWLEPPEGAEIGPEIPGD